LYTKAIILSSIVLCLAGCSGKTSNELYNEGVKELRQGNGSGAIVLFKSVLEKDPKSIDARHQLAKAYMAAGRYEQAEKELQKVQRLNPAQRDIQLDLAKLYHFLKKPDLAFSNAQAFLKDHPNSADALEALGNACVGLNKPQEAEDAYRRALQVEAERSSTKLELAGLYVRSNRQQKASELLNEVIRANPTETRASYMLADLELSQGNKDAAFAIFQKIMKNHKNEPEAPYKAALIQMDKGELASAGKTAAELIAKYPKRAEGYRLKGLVSYQQHNYPEAIASLQNSVKMQPSVLGYYYLGLSLYNQGELENALSQFHQLLDLAPSITQARLLVGVILLKQQRLDDAIAEINRVVQQDERNALAHNILGSAYMAKGLYEEGMKELNLATELNPRIVDAYLKKGLFHLSLGKTSELEGDLKSAVKVAPELLNTRIILSNFYLRRNNHDKAVSVLREGLTAGKNDAVLYAAMGRILLADKKVSEGLACLQKAKQSNPALLDAYFIGAAYHAGIGESQEAMKQYGQILQRDAGNINALLNMAALLDAGGRHGDADAYFRKAQDTGNPLAYQAVANRLARDKDYKKAIEVADQGLSRSPRTVALLEMKGRLQLELKQYKDAVKTFDEIEAISPERGIALKVAASLEQKNSAEALVHARRLVTLVPGSPAGYLLLASIYQRQNDPQRAIDELRNGMKVDAGDPRCALMLAEVHAKAGQYPQAMKICTDLLHRQPGCAAAYCTLGSCLEATGRKGEAVKAYQNALSVSGDYPLALNNLAYLYADGAGSSEQAVKLAQAALALMPDNPGIQDTLGYALLKNGRLQEARKVLERALSLQPGNPTMNYHLALAYRGLGEKGPAADKLRLALQFGEFAEARQARTLLSTMN
jgi:putative PEP-CTERM system TPR-repeat lipoprotein